MTPAPLQVGQAPSELALNSAGFTPLAFANALRIGSSSPVYVAGLLRREPRIAPWAIDTTPPPGGRRGGGGGAGGGCRGPPPPRRSLGSSRPPPPYRHPGPGRRRDRRSR